MTARRVVPDPVERLDETGPDAAAVLARWYAPPRADWVRTNLVASVSGSAAGTDGTSDTLTSALDRAILTVIRELADVVLVGAASVRTERLPAPSGARLAVVTASGDLTGHRLGDDARPIVLCPPGAAARVTQTLPGAEVAVVDGDDALPASGIVAALRSRGLPGIVCEGGPRLARHLLDGDVVDELCLTTAPVERGATLPVFGGAAATEHRLDLTSLVVDDASTTYARWRVLPR